MIKNFKYEEIKNEISSNSRLITRLIFSLEKRFKKDQSLQYKEEYIDKIIYLNNLKKFDDIQAALSLVIFHLVNKKDDINVSPASMHAIRSAFTYSLLSERYSNIEMEERKITVLNILLHDVSQMNELPPHLNYLNNQLSNKIDINKLIVREPILDYSNVPTEDIYKVQTYAYVQLAMEWDSPVFYSGLIADINDTLLGPIFYNHMYSKEFILPMLANFYYMIKKTEKKSDISLLTMFNHIFSEAKQIYDITDKEVEEALLSVINMEKKYSSIANELLQKWKRDISYPPINKLMTK
ncbi:hypothetical protein [Cytobacillus oceanisediminis]|uniref:hypothetical protein n=1 Tax=Cytobacillus oceanisediminis TaxID=665099 RepID=UPI0020797D7F|nr:hypothetical protein [Cytobacillus oceanisediminis]USK44108.1 hypothetical protein LIT27_26675 [Cytobacillus oceanisediminis]